MLQVSDLSVAFVRYSGLLRRSRVEALAGISLSLERGEILGVIGGSGAGKSLLALAILGLLPRNAVQDGTFRFAGEVLTPSRLSALRGKRIALVPQSVAALDPLARTGRQLAFAARRAGIPAHRAEAAAREALARFGLGEEALRAYPHELSGGMARRVLLAAATIGEADLLIVDEPTTGLDPGNIDAVTGHLRRLADSGRAILLISHDLAALLAVADRVAVLREGRLVETAPASAFSGSGRMLGTPYARALWNALPQNAFSVPVDRAAA